MRIGIVGGGITGLALTHALARRGVESVLFERSERLGGVIRTRHENGRILELGPQRTRLVPPVRRLIRELDLEHQVLEARSGAGLIIWARGRLRGVPRSYRLRQLAGEATDADQREVAGQRVAQHGEASAEWLSRRPATRARHHRDERV